MAELINSFAVLKTRHQIKVKFVLVGIWNVIFSYLIYIGLYYIFGLLFSRRYVIYLLALVFCNILSIINSYVFHKYITFKSSKKGMKMVREFVRTSGVYLLTFFVSVGLLSLFVESCQLDPKLAGALTILAITPISYMLHSKFSFRCSDNTTAKVE